MIDAFLTQFNQLSLREKTISLVTVLIIIWGAWDKFFYQSISAEQERLKTELSTLETNLSATKQAAIQAEALAKIDPNKTNRQLLKQAKEELKQLKQQLKISDKKFVPPYLMVSVLQDILQKNKDLKLVQLQTLPVTTLLDAEQVKSVIFRHGLSLTLTGNYFNTLNYLKALEALPWRFNWESINYKVKHYPTAETTIQVYTLSFEENWIGL